MNQYILEITYQNFGLIKMLTKREIMFYREVLKNKTKVMLGPYEIGI